MRERQHDLMGEVVPAAWRFTMPGWHDWHFVEDRPEGDTSGMFEPLYAVPVELRELHAATIAPAPWPARSTPIVDFENAAVGFVRALIEATISDDPIEKRLKLERHTQTDPEGWKPPVPPDSVIILRNPPMTTLRRMVKATVGDVDIRIARQMYEAITKGGG